MPPRKSLSGQYRDNAAECLLKAAAATDRESETSLESLARQWSRLAEHRERSEQGRAASSETTGSAEPDNPRPSAQYATKRSEKGHRPKVR